MSKKSSEHPQPVPKALRALSYPARAVYHGLHRVTVTGVEHIPASGPVILVCNHTVHLDAVVMGCAIYEAGRSPVFTAGSDFFAMPVLGEILRAVGAVPVYREGPKTKDSLTSIRAALDGGNAVLLFPEGTFTRDPQLWPMRGKTGVARLLASHPDVPVVPCAHWGNEAVFDPWSRKFQRSLFRKKVALNISFGAPLDVKVSTEPSYEELTEATETVMSAIEDLLVPLRKASPHGYSATPRAVRWDRRVDGDPHDAVDQAHKERRKMINGLWSKVHKPLIAGKTDRWEN